MSGLYFSNCGFFYMCFKRNRESMYIDEKTIDSTWENTKPFVPPIERGKVIKVYDGDTITIASALPYDSSLVYRFSVRLRGIDTPEIKGKTDNEKIVAKQSRDALFALIGGKVVTLRNVGNEKYGRVLADVYIDDLHINKWMLDNGHAVSYLGGTKVSVW